MEATVPYRIAWSAAQGRARQFLWAWVDVLRGVTIG
jgi:hypothetical protein